MFSSARPGLRAHRRQQRHVLARVRLLRQPGPEHQQAFDLARPAHQRHQRLRQPAPPATTTPLLARVARDPTATAVRAARGPPIAPAPIGSRAWSPDKLLVRGRLERPVVAAAQEHEQRLRVQRLQHRVVDHLGERRAVVGRARLLRQRDQQVPRIVGPAEERAVQPLHRRLPDPAAHQHHQAAKQRPQHQPAARAVHLAQEGHAVEQSREAERHGDARQRPPQSPARGGRAGSARCAAAAPESPSPGASPPRSPATAESRTAAGSTTPRTMAAGRRAASRLPPPPTAAR